VKVLVAKFILDLKTTEDLRVVEEKEEKAVKKHHIKQQFGQMKKLNYSFTLKF
jgi:hypothetical protein